MKNRLSEGRKYCIIAAAVIFFSYIGERFFNVFFNATREIILLEAIVFSLLTFVVYLLLVSSKDAKYGILIAALGFRMMPPDIQGALRAESLGAGVLYYIVEKTALIIFAFAILRLFRYQDEENYITPIAVISVLVLMLFGNDVSSVISDYLLAFTGKMYASYFASFAITTAIEIVLLFIVSQTTRGGAIFMCNFQLVALGLNFARRVLAVIIMTVRHDHISKSYYVWILIFAFFFAAFAILKNKRKKEPALSGENE